MAGERAEPSTIPGGLGRVSTSGLPLCTPQALREGECVGPALQEVFWDCQLTKPGWAVKPFLPRMGALHPVSPSKSRA